jgi:hypothetical protein
MKVQTDVKGGGLLSIVAIVGIGINLFGGGCGCDKPSKGCH